jgi:hypothetical protein
MKIRFQADADLNQIIVMATLRREPTMDFHKKSDQRWSENFFSTGIPSPSFKQRAHIAN